jgi:hypothetical protein
MAFIKRFKTERTIADDRPEAPCHHVRVVGVDLSAQPGV